MEKINVKNFIDKYDSISSEELKVKMLDSLIYRKYVPILEKKLIMQTLFDKSIINNGNIAYVDKFMYSINTTIGIIEMYTNLSFKTNDDENIFDYYDLLAERDLLNLLFNRIPKNEMVIIQSVNSEINETFDNIQDYNTSVNALITRFENSLKELIKSGYNFLSESFDIDDIKGVIKNISENKDLNDIDINNIVNKFLDYKEF